MAGKLLHSVIVHWGPMYNDTMDQFSIHVVLKVIHVFFAFCNTALSDWLKNPARLVSQSEVKHNQS